MTGCGRITNVLTGKPTDRPPILPIIHAGLASHFDVPLGQFFTDADTMARVIIDGYRRFGYDGVQLSLGVTGEAEALGAAVEQPPDAAPILKQHLLEDPADLDRLRTIDPATGGRMPLFFDAVCKVAQEIGRQAFILATLRGPLVIASQLRGIENTLVEMIENPRQIDRILAFSNEVALKTAVPLLDTKPHGVLLGEATCSPNFISPTFYRDLVLPHHKTLVAGLKKIGHRFVGLHICGDISPILDDIISTGVDFLDVDYQVPAEKALAIADNRVALRGNLDPSADLRFATPDHVTKKTRALCKTIANTRWIISTGCDTPPNTPQKNLTALVTTTHAS